MSRTKIVMISQPRYLPSMSFMRRINEANVYVIMDNVQRTERGFENRNFIPINGMPKLLTIPIVGSARCFLGDCEIADVKSLQKHKQTIKQAFSKFPHYDKIIVDSYFENLGANYKEMLILSMYNAFHLLDIRTEILLMSQVVGNHYSGVQQLEKICEKLRATEYVTGFAAQDYGLNESSFKNLDCDVTFDNNQSLLYPYKTFLERIFEIGLHNTKKELKITISNNKNK